MLGGAVGTLQRDRAPGEYGGDVHQRPAALALQVRQRGHSPVDLPHEVDLHDPLELLGRDLLQGSKERDGGEVRPGVEPTVLLGGTVRDHLHLLELRDVSGDGYGLPALIPNLLGKGVEPLLAPSANNYPSPPL